MKVTGIILAGGDSMRMRRDKAFLMFNGERLIDRALSLLNYFCDDVVISANGCALESTGCRVVRDTHRHIGPIAGLFAALSASHREHHLLIPCDTPFLTVDVLERILCHAAGRTAVVAGTCDGLVEPLVGYYHRSAVNPIKLQIQRGDYKMHNALTYINAYVETFSDKKLFHNINTPSDLIPACFPDPDIFTVRRARQKRVEEMPLEPVC